MPTWLLRVAVSAALAGSAVLTFAAAYQRWWPACPRGGFDAEACVRLQSHRYDFVAPGAPWTPVGHAADLYGVALLLLAVAAVLLPTVLSPGRTHGSGGRWWQLLVALSALVPAASLAVLGAATLLSGQIGRAVDLPGSGVVAVVVWMFAWPASLMVIAGAAPGGRPERAVPVAVLVGLSTPIPTLLIFGPIFAGYLSDDTAPWTEAAAAPFLLLAAVSVLLLTPARTTAPALASRRATLTGPRSALGTAVWRHSTTQTSSRPWS